MSLNFLEEKCDKRTAEIRKIEDIAKTTLA